MYDGGITPRSAVRQRKTNINQQTEPSIRWNGLLFGEIYERLYWDYASHRTADIFCDYFLRSSYQSHTLQRVC